MYKEQTSVLLRHPLFWVTVTAAEPMSSWMWNGPSCIKAQWEKCLIRFAVSIMGEGHDGSMLIPTSYCISIQPTTQWKTVQGNSDVIHTFAFCLRLCYCWHLGLVFCVLHQYNETHLTVIIRINNICSIYDINYLFIYKWLKSFKIATQETICLFR